jgi:hypothetical protein
MCCCSILILREVGLFIVTRFTQPSSDTVELPRTVASRQMLFRRRHRSNLSRIAAYGEGMIARTRRADDLCSLLGAAVRGLRQSGLSRAHFAAAAERSTVPLPPREFRHGHRAATVLTNDVLFRVPARHSHIHDTFKSRTIV